MVPIVILMVIRTSMAIYMVISVDTVPFPALVRLNFIKVGWSMQLPALKPGFESGKCSPSS